MQAQAGVPVPQNQMAALTEARLKRHQAQARVPVPQKSDGYPSEGISQKASLRRLPSEGFPQNTRNFFFFLGGLPGRLPFSVLAATTTGLLPWLGLAPVSLYPDLISMYACSRSLVR